MFDKSVKECITYLKNVVLLLLFLTLIYIIILKDYSVWNILIFCYRNLLSLFLIKLFILDENFEKLHSGIYSLLSHFKKGIKNLDSISFDITMSFYYINFLLESKNYIKELKKSKIKKYNFIKYNLIPRLIFADNESKKFINALKLNFYNIKKEKKNLKSKVFVFLSLILFVLTILKEVVK